MLITEEEQQILLEINSEVLIEGGNDSDSFAKIELIMHKLVIYLKNGSE